MAMIQSALLQQGYGVWASLWVASQNPLIVKGDYSIIFGDGEMDERKKRYRGLPIQLIGAAPGYKQPVVPQ